MSNRLRALTVATGSWHLACLAMFYASAFVIGQLILAAYTAWFGDVQESYVNYSRLSTYLGFVVITSPASFVTLQLFDRLLHRLVKWKQRLITFLEWQLLVVTTLICSYEIGFSYMIHEADWALFGPQENLYSFRNLMVDRIIAWLLSTTPVAWIALLRYSKSRGNGPAADQH